MHKQFTSINQESLLTLTNYPPTLRHQQSTISKLSRKVLIYAIGTAGDVFPMLCFGRGLVQAGYQVHMFTCQKWKQRCDEEGIHLIKDDAPCMQTDEGFDPQFAEDILYHGGTFKGTRILLHAFTPIVTHLLDTVLQVTIGYDMVVLSGTSLLLNQTLKHFNIKFCYVFLQPWMHTGEFGCPFISPEYKPLKKPTRSNLFTWKSYLTISCGLFLSKIEDHRKQIGLRTTRLPKWLTFLPDLMRTYRVSFEILGQVPVFTAFSTALVPIPQDLDQINHPCVFHGGPFVMHHSQLAQVFEPPADLAKTDFLSKGSKPIYFGYGSLQAVGKDKKNKQEKHMDIWINCLDRLGSEFRGIFSVSLKGKHKEAFYSSLNPKILNALNQGKIYFQTSSIPHTWLFPQCDLIVHHGGAGTTQTACLSSVPSIVIPHIADQPFMASVLKHHNVAPDALHIKQFNEESFFKLLYKVIVGSNRSYHHAAAELGTLMAKEAPIRDAVKALDAYIDKTW